MQQWNKGVNKSTCINIMLICVKFIHSVEQRKSEKVSLICCSGIKTEEQTFNLIKVGISCLSDMFLKLPKCLEFFFLYQYFDLDKITPFPLFPCQKEKITAEIISSSTKKNGSCTSRNINYFIIVNYLFLSVRI